jgi:hypothetical protein
MESGKRNLSSRGTQMIEILVPLAHIRTWRRGSCGTSWRTGIGNRVMSGWVLVNSVLRFPGNRVLQSVRGRKGRNESLPCQCDQNKRNGGSILPLFSLPHPPIPSDRIGSIGDLATFVQFAPMQSLSKPPHWRDPARTFGCRR